MKRKLSLMNWLFFTATVVAFKYEYLLQFLTFPLGPLWLDFRRLRALSTLR